MRKAKICVGPVDGFFERGRQLASMADRGIPIPTSRVIAFDDIESFLHVLSPKRMQLLKRLQETPASISDLAKNLKRDRSLVARDVQILERFGVLHVTEKPLPGHGKQKWVTPVAQRIQLTAQLYNVK